MRCGLMGTVTYRIGARSMDATRTTPEAPELQSFMRRMVTEGCGACVMEVSSHALSLRRVDGDPVRRARLHESDARPSRLPLEHGGLLRREAAAVRDGTGRCAVDHQRRRSQGAGARRRLISGRSRTGSTNRPMWRQVRCRSRWTACSSTRGCRRAWCACARAWSVGQTSTTSSPPWRRRRRSTSRSTRSKRASASCPACRAIRGGVHPRRRRDGRRRLRAYRRCAEKPARDRAAAGGAAADYGVRRRRRSRSHQAAADGHGGRPAQRRRDHHVGQPARRGPGADHRRSEARRRRRDAPEQRQRAGRSSIGTTRSSRRLVWRRRATSCSSPARGTRSYQEIDGRTLPFDDVAVAREGLEARRVKSRAG